MYVVRNGMLCKVIFTSVGDGYYPIEPAPPITAYGIALGIMRKYEDDGRTDHAAYKYAQRTAIQRMMEKYAPTQARQLPLP
jgi:hypothetical protein